jgi:hypothetical protein
MASHGPFGHMQLKLWAKEGPGVKLAVWLPTIKSQESTSSRRHLKECDTVLESSRWKLQLWFIPRPDLSLGRGAMNVQSPGTLTRDSFETPTWESRKKESLGCNLCGETQRILYGGRRWLPLSPDCGESCVLKCPWLVPTPKGVSRMLINPLVVGFGRKFELDNLVPLPSLIPGLLAHPSTPFSAGSRERPSSPNFPQLYIVGPLSGFNNGLGSASF